MFRRLTVVIIFLSIALLALVFIYLWNDVEINQIIQDSINIEGTNSFSHTTDGGDENWTIESDKVFINDSNVFISAEPHTLQQPGYVEFLVRSKVYTGDVDLVFGFDTERVKPRSIELYKPEWQDSIESYTCDGFFNYTLSPNHGYCYETVQIIEDNVSVGSYYNLIFDHAFDSGDIDTGTIYWNVSYLRDWKDYSSTMDSVNYNYEGMNKWWYNKDVPIVQDVEYKFRVWMDVLPSQSGNGKYWFAIKPSSESVSQAIASEHFYALDPWFNSSWLEKRVINITENTGTSLTNYAVLVNLSSEYEMHGVEDLRFLNSTEDGELDFWVESNDSEDILVWVEVPFMAASAITQVYAYWGNHDVVGTGDGNNVFLEFEDFEDFANTAALKTVWGNGNILLNTIFAKEGLQSMTVTAGSNRKGIEDWSFTPEDYNQIMIEVDTIFYAQADAYIALRDNGAAYTWILAGYPTADSWGFNTGAGGWTESGSASPTDLWYEVKIEVNFTNQLTSSSVNNGTEALDLYGFDAFDSTAPANATELRNNDANGIVVYDNYFIRQFVTNEPSYILGDVETEGGGGDSCTCAGLNNNWVIEHSDSCVINSDCDLGTGRLSFTGSGTAICNATIETSDLGDPGVNGILQIDNSCQLLIE